MAKKQKLDEKLFVKYATKCSYIVVPPECKNVTSFSHLDDEVMLFLYHEGYSIIKVTEELTFKQFVPADENTPDWLTVTNHEPKMTLNY